MSARRRSPSFSTLIAAPIRSCSTRSRRLGLHLGRLLRQKLKRGKSALDHAPQGHPSDLENSEGISASPTRCGAPDESFVLAGQRDLTNRPSAQRRRRPRPPLLATNRPQRFDKLEANRERLAKPRRQLGGARRGYRPGKHVTASAAHTSMKRSARQRRHHPREPHAFIEASSGYPKSSAAASGDDAGDLHRERGRARTALRRGVALPCIDVEFRVFSSKRSGWTPGFTTHPTLETAYWVHYERPDLDKTPSTSVGARSSKTVPVIVVSGAPWCAPCRALGRSREAGRTHTPPLHAREDHSTITPSYRRRLGVFGPASRL